LTLARSAAPSPAQVEKAVAHKNPEVLEGVKKRQDEHQEHEEDDPSKPVPVKSILKNLKPNNFRYSFRHSDEL
jgi:hypothetical protein